MIEVSFKGPGNTSIGGHWIAAEQGCEATSFYLPIRLGAPDAPKVSVSATEADAGFLNSLHIDNAVNNSKYSWWIYSNPLIKTKTGTDVDFSSNYTPLRFTVTAINACGSASFTTGPFDTATIEKERVQMYPNPARDLLHIHYPLDYYGNNGTVSLRILDAYGRTVAEQLEEQPATQTTFTISHLPCGAYALSITGSRKHVYRFAKI